MILLQITKKQKINIAWPATNSLYMLSSKGIQLAGEIVKLMDNHSMAKPNFSDNYLEILENVDLIDLVEQPL